MRGETGINVIRRSRKILEKIAVDVKYLENIRGLTACDVIIQVVAKVAAAKHSGNPASSRKAQVPPANTFLNPTSAPDHTLGH